MSQMLCACGNIISNVSCPSPTEGWIYRDQEEEKMLTEFSQQVKSFIMACTHNQRQDWITTHFGQEYPANSPDEDILFDLWSDARAPYGLSLCECHQCGRLYIQQAPGVKTYIPFHPDSGHSIHILDVKDK